MLAFLKEPGFDSVPVGSPRYFRLQRELIQRRPLMKYCYDTWYAKLRKAAGEENLRPGLTLELGSGGSLLREVVPGLITSDVVEGVADRVIDARSLPFASQSLGAIFLTHVFHHIPDAGKFLEEAARVLKPNGVIAMIEVAHTPFARFFFDHFHPEPYDDTARRWEFDQHDSMMDSNQALSWIVFKRDAARFAERFPQFVVEPTEWLPWFTYLMSGGVTMRNLVPGFLVGPSKLCEWILRPISPLASLHWLIVLRKRG